MGKENLLYRRILVLLSVFAITISSIYGQVPNGMKYQAVVRDNLGRIIDSKTVGVQIKIVQYATDGDAVFVEEHQRTTNEYGLIYLVIGSENPQGFEEIDWVNGPYFVEVGIDIDGGINYEQYGTSELLSVPYALYALHATTADNTLAGSDCIPFVANVVCDYDAVADGNTDDTDAFILALGENNDIFIPASDNPYRISEIFIPAGKRLWFEKGAILDVSSSITGSNTEIIAGDYEIFTSTSTITGTWKSGIAYNGWLANTDQLPGMSAMITPADTTRWGMQTEVSDSLYSANWDGSLEAASKNAIYDKIQSINLEGGSSFIANVVDDYEAIGDGVTDDAQAFSNALNENNDIFIPYSENNYLISNLVIPAGKRLWFEAGAILDVSGNITGTFTEIVAGDYQLFTSTSNLDGTWKSGIAYDGWLANNEQLPGMSAMVTSADTTRWGMQTEVSDSLYGANWDGSLEAASKNAIYDKIQSINLEGGSSFIANVVDDYSAIGDGVTDNAQAFSSALGENNDIFIPYSENNYLISSLVIPAGKRLWFAAGAIIDITGNLTGDSTEISAGDYQLFTSTSNLDGTWKSGIAYDGWLANNEQLPGMSAMVTSADTTRWGTQTEVSDSLYSANWDGSLEAASKNAIYDKIQGINLEGGSSFIANVVDDYAAIGDGVTDNAQAFSSALGENNDIFIPYSENNYLISNLVIPAGKRLWFAAGAIIDITGNLTGDSTEILAGDYQLFTSTSNLDGTWKSGIAYDGWLANNEQLPGMSAMVTSADTTRWGTQTEVSDSLYSANWDGSLEAASKNAIYDKIQGINLEGGSSFIANVVDDYAAIGDGVTDNAQAFSSALGENNDIFIPYSENNYLISNLVIPAGKRLWFAAGAIIDITGNLTGDSTEILAGDYQLFTSTSNLDGTWKSGIAYDGWLANNEQLPGMSAMVTSADTTRWGMQTEVSDSVYSANWDGSLEAASKNAIYDKIQGINLEGGSSFIANVVDDYAAIGDGVTDNAQAFNSALGENNDIFIPYSENNYLISNLVIPAGKRLWFAAGAILDITGNLTGDSTEILAGDYQLFTSSSNLDGTWTSGIAHDGWLANNEQLPGMSAMVTSADTTRWGMQTEVSDSAYSANWDGSLEAASKNAIYDKIQGINLEGGSSFIANVVDDYAAIGDGTTDNAQAFSNAFSEHNDVFVPYSENSYLISNLLIPSGKKLWFETGAMVDVSNSLTGDSTEIIAGDCQLFTETSVLNGSWKSAVSYDSWTGLDQQIPGMIAMVTPADTTRWGIQTEISDSAFSTNWDGSLEAATKNAIFDKIQSINIAGGSSFVANVVDDYAAVADGSTDNALAFSDALSENNDIFIPYADSTYFISNLVIPAGKRIWFEAGAILDITNNIVGDSTEIIAGDYQLFTSSSTISGTWKSGIAYDGWLANNEQLPGMSAMITPADTTRWGIDTYGSGSFIANVIDFGGVSDGATDNAQSFANALQNNNDVFIPKGDSTYLITSLIVPKGKRLWFETGAKLDVTGTLTGDSTEIMAGDQELFTLTSTMEGTWKSGISYNSWSGNDSQIPGMIAMVTPADTARWGIDTYGSGSFIANVIDYGAVGDGSTEDSAAFNQAFSDNNDIFLPETGYSYKLTGLQIPKGKRIWFEKGARIKGSVTGDSTNIVAPDSQIFESGTSINGVWDVESVKAIWFGLTGTLTSTSEWENAVNMTNLSTGKVFQLPLNDTIVTNDMLHLNMVDNTIIDGNGCTITTTVTGDSRPMVSLHPKVGGTKWSTSMSSSHDKYAQEIYLNSVSGIEPGDIVIVNKNDNNYNDLYKVREVKSNHIVVTTPLIKSYSSGEDVVGIRSGKNIKLKNLNVYNPGNGFFYSFYISACESIEVDNVVTTGEASSTSDGGQQRGFQFTNCYDYHVSNSRVYDMTYGMFAKGSSIGNYTNCVAHGGWHGFENTEGSKHTTYNNCTGIDCHYAFRSHIFATEVVLNNCNVYGSQGVQFQGDLVKINGGEFVLNHDPSHLVFGDQNAQGIIVGDGCDHFYMNGVTIRGVGNSYTYNLFRVTKNVIRQFEVTDCYFEIADGTYIQDFGSGFGSYDNCTFEWTENSSSYLHLDQTLASSKIETHFNNCKFLNPPHRGILIAAKWDVFFNACYFGGVSASTDDLIRFTSNSNGNFYFENNVLNTSSVGAWIDGGSYYPNQYYYNNRAYTNSNSKSYIIGVHNSAIISGFSGNKFHPTKVWFNPSQNPTIKESNTISVLKQAPSSPSLGMMYVNSSNNHLYFYNGTTWRQLD